MHDLLIAPNITSGSMSGKSVRPIGCASAGQMARECVRVEGEVKLRRVEWSVNGKLNLSRPLSLSIILRTEMLLLVDLSVRRRGLYEVV